MRREHVQAADWVRTSLTGRGTGQWARQTARLDNRRRGIALVWTAIFLVVLVGIMGLSVDWAKTALNVHQLQNAADAAALAGAQFVRFDHDAARRQAIAVAAMNYADNEDVSLRDNPTNDPALDVVVGNWLSQTDRFVPFDPAADTFANAVKIVAARNEDVPDGPVPLIFGNIFGAGHVNVSREAIAWCLNTTNGNPPLLCLADDTPGIHVQGNGSLTVENGEIQVNSPLDNGATATGNSFTVRADELNVVGDVTPRDRWVANANTYGYSLNTSPNVSPIADPLAGVPDVSVVGMVVYPAVFIRGNQTVTLQPGYYPDGIRVNNGTVTLQPGIYAIGGGQYGLRLNGGTITGNGVMFYITKSQSGTYAQVEVNGNARLQINSPTQGAYEGISFFQDRTNTRDATVNGTADLLQTNGTLYFPSCGKASGGNGVQVGGDGLNLGTRLITWKLYVSGSANVTIHYDGNHYIKAYAARLVK